jgi:hypothetical protein
VARAVERASSRAGYVRAGDQQYDCHHAEHDPQRPRKYFPDIRHACCGGVRLNRAAEKVLLDRRRHRRKLFHSLHLHLVEGGLQASLEPLAGLAGSNRPSLKPVPARIG